MPLVLDVLTQIDARSSAYAARKLEQEFRESGVRSGETYATAMLGSMAAGFRGARIESIKGIFETGALMADATEHGKALGLAFAGGVTIAASGALVGLGIEVGETFEKINRDITLHTAASGQALAELKSHADALVGSLDSATTNLGADMAALGTRLQMTAGPALDQLTQHVEQLRDRMGNFNASAMAGGLANMGVSGADADAAVASLAATVQRTNIPLSELVNNLAANSALFKDMHLTAGQAANMLGEISAKGVDANTAVMGLQMGMKTAKTQGEDFNTFIRSVADSLDYYGKKGDEASAEQISLAVGGPRKWADLQVAAHSYLDTVQQGPAAFAGNIDQLQKMFDDTKTLDNQWHEVRNKVEAALAPVALNVVEDVSHRMDSFVGFLSAHQDDLRQFFATSIDVIQTVVESLGEIAVVLGEHPGLIQAAAIAFGAWEGIKGIQAVWTGLESVGAWLIGAPAMAATSAAGVEASMTEMAATTTAAGTEMGLAFGPIMTELPVIATEAEVTGAAITASMSEADTAVLALNGTLDGIIATLGTIATTAALTAAALAPVLLTGGDAANPNIGPGGADRQKRLAAGKSYADAHGGQMPPGYAQWLDKGGPPPPGINMGPQVSDGSSTPFFDKQGRPLNADGTPVGGGQGSPNPTPFSPGMPKTQSMGGIPGAPAAPGTPGTGTNPDGTPTDLIHPGDLDPKKKGPRLPPPPELPMPAGYGAPPRAGETASQYNAEQRVLEQQHTLEEARARVQQLEKTNTATADDIQKARNEVTKAEKDSYSAQLELQAEELRGLKRHHREMGTIGATLDKDFGISKGLPGIAENITKFVANLTMAGPLAALQSMVDKYGTGGGAGLIGIGAARAGISKGPADGVGANPILSMLGISPQGIYGPGAGAAGAGAAGAGGAGGGAPGALPSFGTPSVGAVNSPEGLAAAGGRVGALFALANSLQGTPYSTQLRNDCSGMVSELAAAAVGMPIPSAGQRFSTANEGQWLQSHGFESGLGGPGDLNIGWHQGGPGGGHTAATLPGGVHAEQGGGTKGDQFTLGPGAAGAENPEFEYHAHLPMGGGPGSAALVTPPGAAPGAGAAFGGGAPGGPGGAVSVYVVNMPGSGIGAAPAGVGGDGAGGGGGPGQGQGGPGSWGNPFGGGHGSPGAGHPGGFGAGTPGAGPPGAAAPGRVDPPGGEPPGATWRTNVDGSKTALDPQGKATGGYTPAPMPGAGHPGAAPSGLNWDALAGAEASGNWGNTSNPKYSGGLQFDQPTWNAYKPPGAPSSPAAATREQQIAAGEAAIRARGGPQSLWPQNWGKLGWQPGGAPPGAGPHPGAAPSGFPGGPHGTDTKPVWMTPGEKVMTTTASHRFGPQLDAMNTDPQYLAGGGDVEKDQQQGPTMIGGRAADKGYGSGMSGGGGGGGMAAGMASGAATMGIGMAAQIGMQEAQRAIQFGGQMAGVGMEALTETFLPTGASKLAQNSWLTKIAGGLSGAQAQIPNTAGKATNPAPQGQQAMTPLPDPSLNAGLAQPGAPAAPAPGAAPTVNINAPTPASVTRLAQHPPDPLNHNRGSSGGHGNKPSGYGSGPNSPAVHIENYHASSGDRDQEKAGQDIARHTIAANSPSRGTSQYA